MSWNPEYAWGGPQQPPSFMGGGYQIPAAALPYLSAEQQQMLGGNNQQNPVDAFIQSLPEGVDRSNPAAILQAAGTNQSLSQAIAERFGLDAGSMTFENPYRNDFGDFALQAAKEVLLPWGIATGVGALLPGAAGAGGAAAAGGGLSEIGLPAGVGYLPGGTGVAGAGASGVAGGFGGAGMASLPAAIGSPGAIAGFTGAAGAGGNLLQDMAAVPSANNPQAGPIPGENWWQDIAGKLGGAISGGALPSVGGGYGQGGGVDTSALMQMMGQLLQRQRQPTPQGPMGARYKPYG